MLSRQTDLVGVKTVHIRSMMVTGAMLGWMAAVAHGVGQTPPGGVSPAGPRPGAPATTPQAPRVRPEAYPQREPDDPAVVARGKTLYSVTCGFCHGSDARGGENNGPNLLRSEVVLMDQHGEKIAPIVQNGRPDRGMPKFDLTTAQIADIAAYVHSFKVGGYDVSRNPPPSIVVGDAKAGATFFTATCTRCHSISGDLAGIGGRFSDPKALQQTWLLPGTASRGPGGPGGGGTNAVKVPPTTVTVTLASGEKVEGRLRRIDDFVVSLALEDGTYRSFTRDGDTPKVEVHDPLEPHRDLLRTYTDKNIHDLTAYLVTVK
jgi:cytochrome c oxidase cbb3-type subunit 3